VIEILILQSLAHQAQGDQPRALASLVRALTLAEPEGYVRIFVDEGEPMVALLERVNASREGGRMKAYLHTLLAAFGKQEGVHPSSLILHPLIEPLSERELEVLKLLRSELSGPEIAERLIVSLNTLRTHTKSIFNKLGVNNRRAAVRHAEELDLF
jgi:LuxR family maltose regulon positive regulatory protein